MFSDHDLHSSGKSPRKVPNTGDKGHFILTKGYRKTLITEVFNNNLTTTNMMLECYR